MKLLHKGLNIDSDIVKIMNTIPCIEIMLMNIWITRRLMNI